MPGLASEETVERLRAIRPDVKILLFSGYSAEDAMRGFEGKGLAGFLQKPFTAQVLVEKVKAVISLPNGCDANGVIMPPHNDVAHNHYPA